MFPISKRIAILSKLYYYQKILATRGANLIGYWPLWEPPGATVAVDLSSQANNGAYGAGANAPTLGQSGIGDGRVCPSFDGNDVVNIYSAAFNTDFNGQEGTFMAWGRITNSAIWTDGLQHNICQIRVNGSNLVALMKYSFDNTLRFQYSAGGTTEAFNTTDYAVTTWLHVAFTWSLSGNVVYGYINGIQVGTSGTLGTWAGVLDATLCNVGTSQSGGGTGWTGLVAHAAVWNVPLTQSEIARLAVK